MPRFFLVLLVLGALTVPSFAKAKRKTYHRAKHAKSSPRRTTSLRSRRGVKAKMPAGRSNASARPSTDRYKEIQQALAAKGYYSGEPDGQWNPSSVEAMKRFQSDQNLTADGSLNSLSLIALGLGPKRTLTAQAVPAQ